MTKRIAKITTHKREFAAEEPQDGLEAFEGLGNTRLWRYFQPIDLIGQPVAALNNPVRALPSL